MGKTTTANPFEVVDHKINYNNIVFYFIDSTNAVLLIDDLMVYDAIIIEASDLEYTRLLIKRIRAHFNPLFYLKPVFLLNLKTTKDPIINNLNDGLLTSLDQIPNFAEAAKGIANKSSQLDYHHIPSFEGQTIKKVLNYMYTRDLRNLNPIADLQSSIGYTYPELSVNFNSTEESQVLDILDWAHREGMLWGEFHEKVYLCNNCNSGFLSYREVCPHCNSSNSKTEDLIHHFPCAYIGPASDFQNQIDNSLSCPKCNKTLRHIGIDYDKPSVIHHCNNCTQNYQDAFVKSKCMACEVDIDVQYLVPKTVYNYKLTRRGISGATSGFLASNNDIDTIFGTINIPTLKIIMHYEKERIKDLPLPKTSIAMVHLDGIVDLYNIIGKKAERTLVEELVSVIREEIKSSDIIAIENTATFYILLMSTTIDEAETSLKKLKKLIESLVKENFNGFTTNLMYKVKILDPEKKSELHLEELSGHLFS